MMDGTEHDINNFSTPSSHRLPTISASEALQNAAKKARGIPTSLPSLDRALLPPSSAKCRGGIQRGQLTEVYGPPGVGKTSFALQLAVNTIQSYDDHSHVVWIDTGSPLVPRRFRAMMAAYKLPESHEPPSSPPSARSRKQLLDKISYFSAQSLPKLLTLFLHPTALFPPPQTALIVIDDFSNLILSSFPKPSRVQTAAVAPNSLQEKLARKAASRKWMIVADLAAAMSKMAALRSLAVVVLNQTATSIKGGRKATLKPAITADGWDAAVRTRILLFRDFPLPDLAQSLSPQEGRGLRFAQVVKCDGRELSGLPPILFVIERGGLRQVNRQDAPDDTRDPRSSMPLGEESSRPEPMIYTEQTARRPAKRKVEEIADSEDEYDNEDGDDLFAIAEGDPIDESPDKGEADDDESHDLVGIN